MKYTIDKQIDLFKSMVADGLRKGVVSQRNENLVFSIAELLHSLGVVSIVSDLKDDHNIMNPVALTCYRKPVPVHGLDFRDIVELLTAKGILVTRRTRKTRSFLDRCTKPPFRKNLYGTEEFVDGLNSYIDKEFEMEASFLGLKLPQFNADHAKENGFSELTIMGLIEANQISEIQRDLRICLHGLYRFLIQRMLIDMCATTGNPIRQSNKGKIDSTISPYYHTLTSNDIKVGFELDYIKDTFSYLSDVLHGNRSDIDETMLKRATEIIRRFANEWKK